MAEYQRNELPGIAMYPHTDGKKRKSVALVVMPWIRQAGLELYLRGPRPRLLQCEDVQDDDGLLIRGLAKRVQRLVAFARPQNRDLSHLSSLAHL